MTGLQKNLVPVAFGQGLKTKIDPKHQVLGTYRKARNVIFETINQFRKRNGYTYLRMTELGGGLLSGIESLAKFKSELLAYVEDSLFAYSPTYAKAIRRGPIYHAIPKVSTVLSNAYNHDSMDMLQVAGFNIYIYHNSTTSEVRYSVEDLSNGNLVVSNALVASGARGRLAAINNTIYLIYSSSTNIIYRSFNLYAPTTLTSPTTLANNLNSSTNIFDARGSTSRVFVAYNSTDASAYLKVASIDSDGSPGPGIGLASSASSVGLNLLLDEQGRLVIGYNAATTAYYAITNQSLATFTTGQTTLETFLANARATLDLTTDIVLTSVAAGEARNETTFQLIVNAPAANPADTVIVGFTGTAAAIVCTVTANDGTNNGGTPVTLDEEELTELINTGAVAGKTITLTDASSLRALQTATGGNNGALVTGDSQTVAFADAIASLSTIDPIQLTSTSYRFQYEVTSALPQNHLVRQNTGTTAGAVGTATLFKRSVGLACKHVEVGESPYTVLVYGSTLQSTYFLADADGVVVAKMSPNAAGSVVGGVLPTSGFKSADEPLIPGLIKTRVKADNGTFFSLLGISRHVVDFSPTHKYTDVFYADNLHIAGGFLQMYDGDNVVEHGYHYFPEAPTLKSSSTSGGFMSDGDYGFVVVYKWTDNVGQDHFSSPSPVLNVTLSGGGSTQSLVIRAPTQRLTQKSDTVVQIYQTEDAGVNYYLTASAQNITTADYVDISVTKSDTTLITQEAIYTTGGVLENIAPPAVAVIGAHTAANRLVVVGEESNTLIFSKIRLEGRPVEFTDAIKKYIDPVGGIVTAIASMDEKLIIFERNATFYIAGQGPLNTGEQDTYTEPERISIDVGCIDPVSVCLIPQGLMFKSDKGIYLLHRSLQMEYIGADVEAYNNLTITSAKLVPTYNEARFTTSNGDCLVYNYFSNQWATNSNQQGLDAEIVENLYYYLRTDGQIFYETAGVFNDYGSSISFDIETGWINLTALQGYQRVYKLLLLAGYKSSHTLRIQIAYDYNEADIQEVTINPQDFLEGTGYGDASPYGSESPYGGNGNVYHARIDFKKQKCTSFKLRITDQQAIAGEGLTLSGMTLQVGAKKGVNKLANNRQFGLD